MKYLRNDFVIVENILFLYRQVNSSNSNSVKGLSTQSIGCSISNTLLNLFEHRDDETNISVYSHDPIEDQEIVSDDLRIQKIFSLLQNYRNVNNGHGVYELKIQDILEEVNGYQDDNQPLILDIVNIEHPHYGLIFDKDNEQHRDNIVMAIYSTSALFHPYKDYKI